MLLKPAAALAVSEVSKKKPGPRPGGASTAGGTAQSGQPRVVLPPALRSSLPRTPVPSDRGLRRSFLPLPPSAPEGHSGRWLRSRAASPAPAHPRHREGPSPLGPRPSVRSSLFHSVAPFPSEQPHAIAERWGITGRRHRSRADSPAPALAPGPHGPRPPARIDLGGRPSASPFSFAVLNMNAFSLRPETQNSGALEFRKT